MAILNKLAIWPNIQINRLKFYSKFFKPFFCIWVFSLKLLMLFIKIIINIKILQGGNNSNAFHWNLENYKNRLNDKTLAYNKERIKNPFTFFFSFPNDFRITLKNLHLLYFIVNSLFVRISHWIFLWVHFRMFFELLINNIF